MTPLSPMDLDLLDFLCICAEKKIKVVRIKAPRLASLRRLREAGQVAPDDYLPSAPALLRWIERHAHHKSSEAPNKYTRESRHAFGDQRCGLSDGDREALSKIKPGDPHPPLRYKAFPPIAENPFPAPAESAHAITDDLRFFGHEWEPLGIVADRWGRGSGVQFRGTAIKLRDLGLVEMQFIRGVDAQARWRLAEIPSTKGPHPLAEPPAVAPTADESAVAADEPNEPRPAFEEAGRPVDLKVNARRRTSRSLPCSHANEAQTFQRQVQRAMRTNRANAEAFLDSGKTSGQAKSVSLKIEARKVELARIETARLEDPVEQAKTIIRRAGWVCFSAIISGGPVGKFYIGTRLVTEAQLLAQAEQLRARRRVG